MSTATVSRHRLTATELATVQVENWFDLGDQREERDLEDGSVHILNPEPAPVVTVVLDRGDYLVLSLDLPNRAAWANWHIDGLLAGQNPAWNEAMLVAETMAARIRTQGTINPDKWHYLRAVYGSAAYFQDGYEDLDRSLD